MKNDEYFKTHVNIISTAYFFTEKPDDIMTLGDISNDFPENTFYFKLKEFRIYYGMEIFSRNLVNNDTTIIENCLIEI